MKERNNINLKSLGMTSADREFADERKVNI